MKLDEGQEVVLQRGENEIHARSVTYQAADQGRMGQVEAQGPGWFRGQSPDRPDQQLEVTWYDTLTVEPQGKNQLISLKNGAELRFPGVGKLQAWEIFMWLAETPGTTSDGQSGLQPKKMFARVETPRAGAGPARPQPGNPIARDEVRIESPQLTGRFGQKIEVWFEPRQIAVRPAAGESRAAAVAGPAAVASAVAAPPPQAAATQQASPQPARQFNVQGRELRANVLLGGREATVSDMTIEGNVHFAGDGMTLSGPNLNFDGAKNSLSVEGAGQMEFPPSQLMQGETSTASGTLQVSWRRRMDFDGLTARFEESVVATTQQQQLDTQRMNVTLQRPIRLMDGKTGDRPDIDNIQCFGGAWLKNRSFDAEQQLCSFDQLQVSDLTVSLLTGAVNGSAGWINSVQYASADMLGGPNPAAKTPPIDTPPQKQLFCLHVTFEKEMIGNLGDIRSFSHGWLTFSDRVHVTYGPVDNWEAQLATSDPDEPRPEGHGGQLRSTHGVANAHPRQAQPVVRVAGGRQCEGGRHPIYRPRLPHHLQPGEGPDDHRGRWPQRRRVVAGIARRQAPRPHVRPEVPVLA